MIFDTAEEEVPMLAHSRIFATSPDGILSELTKLTAGAALGQIVTSWIQQSRKMRTVAEHKLYLESEDPAALRLISTCSHHREQWERAKSCVQSVCLSVYISPH